MTSLKTFAALATLAVTLTLPLAGCTPHAPKPVSKTEALSQKYSKLHHAWMVRYNRAEEKMVAEQGALEELYTPEAKMRVWAAKNDRILQAYQAELNALNAAERRAQLALADQIIASK